MSREPPRLESVELSRPGRSKSPQRLLVERVLAAAQEPLTRRSICARSQLPSNEVTRVISTMIASGAAHRNEQRPAGYLLGPKPPQASAPPARTAERQLYDGRELAPYTGRPGAMDAFALPSLQAGQRVPRHSPHLLGSSVRGDY